MYLWRSGTLRGDKKTMLPLYLSWLFLRELAWPQQKPQSAL
jgi:hypothetical protein